MNNGLSAIDISASGLAAERLRMETTANNIANANTMLTETGLPFRRMQVILGSAQDTNNGGVKVLRIEQDDTPLEWIHNPGHPNANEEGYVQSTNVKIPHEMIDLISASRSYEANLRSITLYKEMVEQTLSLLNGGR